MFEFIFAIIIAICSFVLASFVYLKNKRSGTNIYFSGLIFFLSLYPVANYLALSTSETSFWARVILFISIPVGPLFYSFVRVFPTNKIIYSQRVQTIMLVWIIANYVFAGFNLIFSSVSITNGALEIIPGPLVASFASLQLLTVLLGFAYLFKKYRESNGLFRRQLLYIILGVLVGFGSNILATIILPLAVGFSQLIPISPLFFFLGELCIAYAIIRHKLLDIRPSLSKIVAFSFVVLMISIFYVLVLFLSSRVFFGSLFEGTSILLVTGLTLFGVIVFQPVLSLMKRIAEKLIYKDVYNSNDLLYKLSTILASSFDKETMAVKSLAAIVQEMKIKNAHLLMKEKKKHVVFSYVKSQKPLTDIDDSAIFQTAGAGVVNVENSSEGTLKSALVEKGVRLAVPLTKEKKVIAALLLEEKLSGEAYSEKDIEVLTIFASQAAVALDNINAYQEISAFNITLKEEVKKATTKLKSMNQNLRNLDRLKDEFLSIASHELRTPMTAIKSYIYMTLSGKGGKVTKKQKYYLERSYMATERLIKLVNNLLNISRIESGRISLELEKINLYRLTDEVFDEVRARAEELGLSISQTKLEEQKKLEVIADTDKVKEVLINYIGNSLKFTPKGGSITVSYEVADDMIWTRVTDTGAGVSQEDLGNLFQKFGLMEGSYQVNQNVSQGTGLGLYICKSVIELHGGEVDATSPGVGKGTVFSFSLPLYTAKKYLGLKKKFGGKDGVGIVHTSAS